jgi:hypothetical protein
MSKGGNLDGEIGNAAEELAAQFVEHIRASRQKGDSGLNQ